MSTVLFVSGTNLDVERYAHEQQMKIEKIWRKGEIKSPMRPERGVHEQNSFICIASETELDDLNQQITDTIKFLTDNLATLAKLDDYGKTEERSLSFGIWCTIDDDHIINKLLPLRTDQALRKIRH